ncbi:hypothetical protein Ctob_004656 [Chrysochromulina tobinii]|uniref:Uncharacterized protein n=1 Tax=Chrysochromulina tobinii TaxID=1460289 RepID=A0A0M0JP16_9EUKA|nr:hypothetical protein Ctob_004656 [Chrysochromulina tobinii]|eukprot:KOO28339.1 hypothetical protein Ctob_004656 [Chrysochromulina sp. CCMP291]
MADDELMRRLQALRGDDAPGGATDDELIAKSQLASIKGESDRALCEGLQGLCAGTSAAAKGAPTSAKGGAAAADLMGAVMGSLGFDGVDEAKEDDEAAEAERLLAEMADELEAEVYTKT